MRNKSLFFIIFIITCGISDMNSQNSSKKHAYNNLKNDYGKEV